MSRTPRDASSSEVFVSDFAVVDGSDEDQLAAALIAHGPLAIGINASPMQWSAAPLGA